MIIIYITHVNLFFIFAFLTLFQTVLVLTQLLILAWFQTTQGSP